MGVHGLWKLIEPSGQMVPLESLAGKVLAVDVSIWLHQAIKGMHDAHGAPLAVAHLLILFHRVCKLLFYKIKPVFVFDGGVPALKHQTMAARRQRTSVAKSEAMKVREKLIKNLLKHEAVRHMLSDETASAALGLNSFTLPGPSVEEDLYKLPPIAADFDDSEVSDELSSSDEESKRHTEDIHSIDVTSQEFLSLPPEVRHDMLTELIETRKQSSWKNLDNMPKKSDNFSDFQMNRLLKRHAVQTSLEKAGKEMGGRSLSLKELESLLGDQGVLDPKVDLPSRRIAQDSITRYVLIQKELENPLEPKEGDKFDIMNHLEDVDWSSESDTDIILQRSPESQKGLKKTDIPLNSKQEPIEEEFNKSQEHNGPGWISKQPKVRITKEVADILSILEDQQATADVKAKVENLQTKINFNENSENLRTSQSIASEVKSSENNSEVNLINPNDDVKPSVSNTLVPTHSPDTAIEGKEINEKELLETENINENINNIIDIDIKVEPLIKTMSGTPNSSVVVKVVSNSSSDSENDFIPITNEESEILLSGTIGKKSDDLSEFSTSKNNPLTVVINPLELGQKDDLFADVFDPRGEKNENEIKEVTESEKPNEFEKTNECYNDFGKEIPGNDFNELKKTLEEQRLELLKEKGKQERLALNLTDQAYTDAQELLRLFGIPFVVAPMEAEAQCATLNVIGLTEGTITDDSDIWLFGGQVVYKNFFNQQKHVLEYRSENIQKHFKLTREEMIKMALLVGSDYTLGLNGIGPVTALEIIAAFQTSNHDLLESLQKFRDWFTGSATGGLPRITLRKKIKNTVITPGFPNRAVIEAYLKPRVDDSKEPFSWAKPNLDLIYKYVRAKLGWSNEKSKELLLPVMKKLEENTNQSTIDRHFQIIQKPTATEGLLSKRVENAIKRLGGTLESDVSENEVKPRKKRKPVKVTPVESSSKDDDESTEEMSKVVAKPKTGRKKESLGSLKNVLANENTKIKLINEKLHKTVEVPQKEMAQKLLEEKKREAIKIFRTFKKGGKRKTRVYAKEEANLSESSSEND